MNLPRTTSVATVCLLAGSLSTTSCRESNSDAVTADPKTAPLVAIAEPPIAVSAECAEGPVASRPGAPILASRAVALKGDGEVHGTLRFLGAKETTRIDKVPNDLQARIAGNARRALAVGAVEPELPVPDGMSCRITITEGARTLTLQLASPTSRTELAPLLDDLVRLLPARP